MTENNDSEKRGGLSSKGVKHLLISYSMSAFLIVTAWVSYVNPVGSPNPAVWAHNVITFTTIIAVFLTLVLFIVVASDSWGNEEVNRRDTPKTPGDSILTVIYIGLLIFSGFIFSALVWTAFECTGFLANHDAATKQKKRDNIKRLVKEKKEEKERREDIQNKKDSDDSSKEIEEKE